MESQKYITYLLLFILISVVLVIFVGLYNNINIVKTYNIEHFFTTTTVANALTPLIPVLQNSNDNLNKLRFSWIDNQQRLDDITKRINKVKNSLGDLNSQTSMYSASGKMTFY